MSETATSNQNEAPGQEQNAATDEESEEGIELEAADHEIMELLGSGDDDTVQDMIDRFKRVRGKFLYPIYKRQPNARRTPDRSM